MAYELIAPKGGHVIVETAERAEVLKSRGYKPAETEKKPARKQAATAKKEQ